MEEPDQEARSDQHKSHEREDKIASLWVLDFLPDRLDAFRYEVANGPLALSTNTLFSWQQNQPENGGMDGPRADPSADKDS